jgi:hypothetical protein
MILYHFTYPAKLEHRGTILKDGILPSVNPDTVVNPLGVVWLTTLEDYPWEKGLSSERGMCRIEVVIPSHDRRLKHWPKWARKHDRATLEILARCDCGFDHMREVNTSYVYFGVIPPDWFTSIDGADQFKDAA